MSIKVSVVVPILNEEKYIAQFLDSLINQDFPNDKMEILLLDGNSIDKTREIITNFINRRGGNIQLIDNPKKIQSAAMNVGLAMARGEYVVRLDAHAEYPSNYISSCIKLLDETGADNVGFCIETRGKGRVGRIISKVMSSKFGVGNSGFRTKTSIAKAETVPFGAFKKSTLEKIGGFNEHLRRNEDNDVNYRIREIGGTVLLSNDLNAIYYCRDSVWELLKMAFSNGYWNAITLYYSPKSMRVRHFIPLCFVCAIISLSLLGLFHFYAWYILLALFSIYIFVGSYFVKKDATTLLSFFAILFCCFLFHLSYGTGSIIGMGKLFKLFIKHQGD